MSKTYGYIGRRETHYETAKNSARRDDRIHVLTTDGGVPVPPETSGLLLEKNDALYRETEEGLVLVGLSSKDLVHLQVEEGCIAIADGACFRHKQLITVSLPEGFRKIGQRAFEGCENLASVEVCESLESVGAKSFLETSLKSFHLPAGFAFLGMQALAARRFIRGSLRSTLHSVTVDEECQRFYMEQGMLIERYEDGSEAVHLFAGENFDITMPDSVSYIYDSAFTGTDSLHRLRLHDGLRYIGPGALCTTEAIDVIEFAMSDGELLQITFPRNALGRRMMHRALSCEGVDLKELFYTSDNAQFMADDHYMILSHAACRLANPVMLGEGLRSRMLQCLTMDFRRTCREFAEHRDQTSFETLLDLGILNDDNLSEAIDIVSACGDAAITGWLLEIKRQHTGGSFLDDFDI